MKDLLFVILLTSSVLGACGPENKVVSSAVFVSIDDFTHKYEPGSKASLPLVVLTTGEKAWQGPLSLKVMKGDSLISQVEQSVQLAKETEERFMFSIELPRKEGVYQLVAELPGHEGQAVRNKRLIEVETPIRVKIN